MPWIEQLQSANWSQASYIALSAYLLGCFTTGYYLVRMRTGQDIRELGSGSVGAKNVGRILGWRGFLTTVLGYISAIYVPPMLGVEIQWGTVGLTLTAGIAGWVEFLLLRFSLNKKIGKTGLPLVFTAKLWGAAAIGAGIAWAVKIAVGHTLHPIIIAFLVTFPYGVIYFLVASALGVKEARAIVSKITRKIPGFK